MSPEKIKGIRQKIGITQERFANKVGVTSGTINRWEHGLYKPHRVFIERMELLSERYSPEDSEAT